MKKEKIIYKTKKEQKEREKNFLISQKLGNTLEKIQEKLVKNMCEKLKNDEYLEFYWGSHDLHINFDEYYYDTYSLKTDSVKIWIANGADHLSFTDSNYINAIPKSIKGELWEIINNVKKAQLLKLKYKEYLKVKKDKKTEVETKKQEEIEKAKELLKKEGINYK